MKKHLKIATLALVFILVLAPYTHANSIPQNTQRIIPVASFFSDVVDELKRKVKYRIEEAIQKRIEEGDLSVLTGGEPTSMDIDIDIPGPKKQKVIKDILLDEENAMEQWTDEDIRYVEGSIEKAQKKGVKIINAKKIKRNKNGVCYILDKDGNVVWATDSDGKEIDFNRPFTIDDKGKVVYTIDEQVHKPVFWIHDTTLEVHINIPGTNIGINDSYDITGTALVSESFIRSGGFIMGNEYIMSGKPLCLPLADEKTAEGLSTYIPDPNDQHLDDELEDADNDGVNDGDKDLADISYMLQNEYGFDRGDANEIALELAIMYGQTGERGELEEILENPEVKEYLKKEAKKRQNKRKHKK